MYKSPTIKAMENAAIKAGKGLSRDFGELENLQISKKGPGDFVTSADLRAEEVIIEELNKFRPQYGLLSEEREEEKGKDKKFRWIIDPLDGTTNFMHGIPLFSTSIALEETLASGKKEIIAGVVFAPALNEMFWAEKNSGAFCNGRKTRVSGRNTIEDSLFASYPWHGRSTNYDNEAVAREISNSTANVRILGSAALDLAYVAAGKLDGFWHNNLKPWDLAAASLLIREAGGIVTDINDNSDISSIMQTGGIIASSEQIHSKLLKIIKKHKKT